MATTIKSLEKEVKLLKEKIWITNVISLSDRKEYEKIKEEKQLTPNRMSTYWAHTFINGIAICWRDKVILVKWENWQLYCLENWEQINIPATYICQLQKWTEWFVS